MNEKKLEKLNALKDHYEMDEMERYMAMSWGTPAGFAMLFVSFAIFLLSIGGFLWLLHLANIIK